MVFSPKIQIYKIIFQIKKPAVLNESADGLCHFITLNLEEDSARGI